VKNSPNTTRHLLHNNNNKVPIPEGRRYDENEDEKF
jgi:hypothetical protein